MNGPLAGVRVLEVAGWAFVPCAGVILADWGADVVKIEPPEGDPVRGLVSGGVADADGLAIPWEIWNRNKRSLALDLTRPDAKTILFRLVEQADVFLTSYLPDTRARLGIDLVEVRRHNPAIVYACGTGYGSTGPDCEKGGYDAISFWGRGGISFSVTPVDGPKPLPMPAGAFGDSISGLALAGGIAAALARKARTGEGSVADGSLFSTALWSMQMSLTTAAIAGPEAARAPQRVFNPLVNSYRTADDRWVGLCMMQADIYWDGLCRAIERLDLLSDERLATPRDRRQHRALIIEVLERTFAARPLAHWREALATQKGQWDVVKTPSELSDDPQAVAAGFIQRIDYGDGRLLPVVTAPVHFDHTPPKPSSAPAFSGDADEILQSVGFSGDEILEAKISGAVI